MRRRKLWSFNSFFVDTCGEGWGDPDPGGETFNSFFVDTSLDPNDVDWSKGFQFILCWYERGGDKVQASPHGFQFILCWYPAGLRGGKGVCMGSFQFILCWYARSSRWGPAPCSLLSIHSLLILSTCLKPGILVCVTFNSFFVDTHVFVGGGIASHERLSIHSLLIPVVETLRNSFVSDVFQFILCWYTWKEILRLLYLLITFNSFFVDTPRRPGRSTAHPQCLSIHSLLIPPGQAGIPRAGDRNFQFILCWYKY